MQKLPFSIQDFSNIREFDYLYIDKTKYAHDLVIQKGQSFFLSRPRRFGKLVFVSTLKKILLGKRNLFKGLWIAKSDYKWPVYGVIHSLCHNLENIAEEHQLGPLDRSSPNGALTTLVARLHKKFKKSGYFNR